MQVKPGWQRNIEHAILEEHERIGDSWRKRWDSLHLFTPAKYDGLPGLKFTIDKNLFPGKDAMADYLELYATHFKLPVRLRSKVNNITEAEAGFLIESSSGKYAASKIIIASGTHSVPKVPAFSSQLNPDITQIHSSQYINPAALPDGDILVVGAGTSGVEIAIEVSQSGRTYISGTPTFHIPDNVFKYLGKFYWWFVNNILTVKTPIGRKAKMKILKGGGPLINISVEDLDKAGVIRLERTKGVENGFPVMVNGTVAEVKTVIWCTGFKPDFSWIDIDILNETGWPDTDRGISKKQNGLYFMGMPFQFGLTSGLVGGVGRDADYVIKKLVKQ